jgi:hypothetical protein
VKVWWFNKPNYGDILTPHILNAYGVTHKHVAMPQLADAICVGSIARLAHKDCHVLGSGFMRRADMVCKTANYHWLRGPHSRQMVLEAGCECPEVYGDPAMLLPTFWDAAPKVHDLGIVPHYVDYKDCQGWFPDYPVINLVNHHVKSVTRQITQCRAIISSSLHGLIVAHAYGIPAAWVQFSDRLNGDGIKFDDHYAALGISEFAKPSLIEAPVYTTGSLDITPMQEILKQWPCR